MSVGVCAACGKSCAGVPSGTDSTGRLFHRDCYERALRQTQAGRSARAQSPSSLRSGNSSRNEPGFVNPGELIRCTNNACGRKFRVPRRVTLTQLGKTPCPQCGCPLKAEGESRERVDQSTGAERPDLVKIGDELYCTNVACGQHFRAQSEITMDDVLAMKCPICGGPLAPSRSSPSEFPIAAANIAGLLDEERENSPRRRLARMLAHERSGLACDEDFHRMKQRLIDECLSEDPSRCPCCNRDIASRARLCNACGLRFAGTAAGDVQDKYVAGLLAGAKEELAKEEEMERLAQEQLASALAAHSQLHNIFGGWI